MTERDKEVILRYINILGEEILRDEKIAKDLDEKIEKIDIEAKNISPRDVAKAFNFMRKRIKIAKAMIKNHDNIHKMIDYVEAEGYEIIREGCKAVKIVEKGDKENDN